MTKSLDLILIITLLLVKVKLSQAESDTIKFLQFYMTIFLTLFNIILIILMSLRSLSIM